MPVNVTPLPWLVLHFRNQYEISPQQKFACQYFSPHFAHSSKKEKDSAHFLSLFSLSEQKYIDKRANNQLFISPSRLFASIN
jgi:hypothetical protein